MQKIINIYCPGEGRLCPLTNFVLALDNISSFRQNGCPITYCDVSYPIKIGIVNFFGVLEMVIDQGRSNCYSPRDENQILS